MDQTLRIIQRNLATLEAIRDFDKLRIIVDDGEDVGALSIGTHHLAIEERYLFQGLRRGLSGDGHDVTIAFIRHLIESILMVANCAFKQYHSLKHERAVGVLDAEDMFERLPMEVLQDLSRSISASTRGLERLKTTTYTDSTQIGVELNDLIDSFTKISNRIDGFLLAPEATCYPKPSET